MPYMLIGRLGNKATWPWLSKIYEAENQSKDSHVLSHAMRKCAIMALLRLNEPKMKKVVEDALHGNNVTSMALAIECVEYSEKKEYVPALIKLLDDTRDAKDVEKFGTGIPYYMRVNDLAADAVLNLLNINKIKFKQDYNHRYSLDQFNKIKVLDRKY